MKYLKFLAAMFYMLAVFTACENDIETKMEDLENRIENLENGGSTMGGTNGSSASTGTENGHEYVDLGLSVKWATCNVGATRPEYFGNYYAWGETTPNTDYYWDNYKWCNGSSTTMTKYCTDSDYGTVDNKTVLDKEDDAAAVNMGGSWRMPTLEEWTELIDNCTWEITDSYKGTGVEGRILKSDINGNSIFLPAAGYHYNSDLSYAGTYGHYWSSSLNTDDSSRAYYLNFYSDRVSWSYYSRCRGLSVRGVFK